MGSSGGSLTPTPTASVSVPNPVAPGPSVGATVGEFYLNLSGYSSPFALISLISDDVSLRSTISDEKGNFSISQVLIKSGFSNFCLTAKDFRNQSSSQTCINITPATSSVVIGNIFLPPSLALWKNKITFYEPDLAFGYTMSQATVTLHINLGGETGSKQTMTSKADTHGYYRFVLKLPAGKYDLYATAKYKNNDSRAPSKTVSLEVLDALGLLLNMLRDLFNKFISLFTSLGLGPLWLALPVIILIIILLIKLWGKKFTSLAAGLGMIIILFGRRKKKLHHYWFVGY
jgi:hypothetical protein